MSLYQSINKTVIIRDEKGKIYTTGLLTQRTKTLGHIANCGEVLLKTGRLRYKPDWTIHPATKEELDAAIEYLRQEDECRDREYERKRQAEYDALPEEIKLARKLEWFCSVSGEKVIARIPINLLRQVVQWIQENNYECE